MSFDAQSVSLRSSQSPSDTPVRRRVVASCRRTWPPGARSSVRAASKRCSRHWRPVQRPGVGTTDT